MQKYGQKIAIITLISVLTVIFLYINYTIWGGSYIKGDIEDNIRHEMHLIGESSISEPSAAEINNEFKKLLSTCLIPGIITCVMMSCVLFITVLVYHYNFSNTLVTLSVRLNN